MTLYGKIEEIKRAKIRAMYRDFKTDNPDKDTDTIKEMVKEAYNTNLNNFLRASRILAITALTTLGIVLAAQGLSRINSNSSATSPQISYEYLTEDQKNLIDSLDGEQLSQYVSDFSTISSQPEHLHSSFDSKRATEITEHSKKYLNDFKRYQEGLLPFFASFEAHPEKYTEKQMLEALETSNDLMGRYSKNQAVALILEHNTTTTDPDSKIYIIPDPADIYFYQGSNAERQMLAECEITDSGLLNKGSLYVKSNFKSNGFDEAINAYFSNKHYYDEHMNGIEADSNDSNKIKRTIQLIMDNNEVVDSVLGTRAVIAKHWFNFEPTLDFEYRKDDEKDTTYLVDSSNLSQGIEVAQAPTQEVPDTTEARETPKDDGPEL